MRALGERAAVGTRKSEQSRRHQPGPGLRNGVSLPLSVPHPPANTTSQRTQSTGAGARTTMRVSVNNSQCDYV